MSGHDLYQTAQTDKQSEKCWHFKNNTEFIVPIRALVELFQIHPAYESTPEEKGAVKDVEFRVDLRHLYQRK